MTTTIASTSIDDTIVFGGRHPHLGLSLKYDRNKNDKAKVLKHRHRCLGKVSKAKHGRELSLVTFSPLSNLLLSTPLTLDKVLDRPLANWKLQIRQIFSGNVCLQTIAVVVAELHYHCLILPKVCNFPIVSLVRPEARILTRISRTLPSKLSLALRVSDSCFAPLGTSTERVFFVLFSFINFRFQMRQVKCHDSGPSIK